MTKPTSGVGAGRSLRVCLREGCADLASLSLMSRDPDEETGHKLPRRRERSGISTA